MTRRCSAAGASVLTTSRSAASIQQQVLPRRLGRGGLRAALVPDAHRDRQPRRRRRPTTALQRDGAARFAAAGRRRLRDRRPVRCRADAFGRTDNYVTFADSFGGSGYYWHGVDINVNARLASGLTVQGGTSTGRRVSDSVLLARRRQSRAGGTAARRYPFLTDYRGLAAYTIRKVDVQVSATLQSRPGPELVGQPGRPERDRWRRRSAGRSRAAPPTSR